MKLYLDDERETPSGFERVYTSQECIALLEKTGPHNIDVLSLDHDLGGDDTGYKVLQYLEQQAAHGKTTPKLILVHSANPVGRNRMNQAIESIRRLESDNA